MFNKLTIDKQPHPSWNVYKIAVEQIAEKMNRDLQMGYPNLVIYHDNKINEIQDSFHDNINYMKIHMSGEDDKLARHKIASAYVQSILKYPVFELNRETLYFFSIAFLLIITLCNQYE